MVDVGFRPVIRAVFHFLCVKLQIFVCFRKVIDKFFAFFFGERHYGVKKPAMQNCKAGHIVSTRHGNVTFLRPSRILLQPSDA